MTTDNKNNLWVCHYRGSRISVYNLKGQLIETIVNKNVVPGSYSFIWNASALTSGLYFMSVNYDGKTLPFKSKKFEC